MQALASNVMDQLWEAKQQRTQRMCNLIFVLVTTDFITSDNISLVVTILRCGHKMAWCFVIIKMTSWQNSDSHQHRCPRSNSSELLLWWGMRQHKCYSRCEECSYLKWAKPSSHYIWWEKCCGKDTVVMIDRSHQWHCKYTEIHVPINRLQNVLYISI